MLVDDDHGDSRHITLLDLRCAAEAAGVSVLEAAANLSKTVASCCKMTQDRADAMGLVIKADPEQRYLLTVAYPAWKADIAVAADGHIDFAPDAVVVRACWNFMRKGCELGLYHEDGHDPAALGEVVENYIFRADPWVIKAADGTEQVIMPGDWLIGAILTPATWRMFKAGLIGGVSPEGRAARRVPSSANLARLRS